jgi:hypothetical protein
LQNLGQERKVSARRTVGRQLNQQDCQRRSVAIGPHAFAGSLETKVMLGKN